MLYKLHLQEKDNDMWLCTEDGWKMGKNSYYRTKVFYEPVKPFLTTRYTIYSNKHTWFGMINYKWYTNFMCFSTFSSHWIQYTISLTYFSFALNSIYNFTYIHVNDFIISIHEQEWKQHLFMHKGKRQQHTHV